MFLSEAKADSFASIVVPDFKVPWTRELSPEDEQTIWNWLKERRYTFKESDLAEMRNGSGVMPRWSDYRIGYHIMQEFLKQNPNVSIEEWTFMDTDKILEMSGFLDK